jgi:hypothetical protein
MQCIQALPADASGVTFERERWMTGPSLSPLNDRYQAAILAGEPAVLLAAAAAAAAVPIVLATTAGGTHEHHWSL